MGGGDLNLKKSWHPHTMKNQEKVWKAEQAKTQEERKVNDLRKEIEEERNREELKRIGRDSGVLVGTSESDKKLDWMYKNSNELINREEYLLGRKIDKSFETLQAEEKEREKQNLVGVKQPLNHVEHECVPFSIRAYKNVENSDQVDLQRKVMEDPLMIIKQREMESRRKILENPVKLKELHRILKTDEKLRKLSKKLKKSKKGKKSKKREKRKKSLRSSKSRSCSKSDSDLDTKLAKKLKDGLLNMNLNKLLDSKFEKISQELDKAACKNKHLSKTREPSSSDSDSSCSSYRKKTYMRGRSRLLSDSTKSTNKDPKSSSISIDREKRHNKYEHWPSRNYSDRRQENRFTSTNKFRDSNSRQQRPIYSKTENVKIDHKSTLKESRYTSRRDRSRSTSRDSKKSYRSESELPAKFSTRIKHRYGHQNEKQNSTSHHAKKLTYDEKQAKLKEMMSNAAWREEERTEVVRKHRASYAKEEESHNAQEFDRNFLSKEVKKAMDNQTSVGSRLRANLNNIQRTSVAMNTNFARK